jgi:hypothetical protein
MSKEVLSPKRWYDYEEFFCQECKKRVRVMQNEDYDYDDIWYSLVVDAFHLFKKQKYYFCSLGCLKKFIESKGNTWLPEE